MKVTIGKKGLKYTWQEKFPSTTRCCRCGGKARIGFVAHESIEDEEDSNTLLVRDLYDNEASRGGKFWLHDSCAVAVYFCERCLEPTAEYNQA